MAVSIVPAFSFDIYENNPYSTELDASDSGGSSPKDQQDSDDVNFFFNFENVSLGPF